VTCSPGAERVAHQDQRHLHRSLAGDGLSGASVVVEDDLKGMRGRAA